MPDESSPPQSSGRVVLITGGSRGIGLATAQRFAALGDRVAVTYNSSPPPDGFFAVKCDVTSSVEVDAAFTAIEKHFGPVEILVSNAGMTKDMLILRMSESDFADVIDANLTAAYRVAKRAAQGMLKARKGRMIFVSSVVGMLGSAGQANYSASKSGLIGLARSIARELGSRTITANVVAPGFTSTDMVKSIPEKVQERILSKIPLRRFADPQEIGWAVAFLMSPVMAGYITGETMSINGGQYT